jgi:hypothetical protein
MYKEQISSIIKKEIHVFDCKIIFGSIDAQCEKIGMLCHGFYIIKILKCGQVIKIE